MEINEQTMERINALAKKKKEQGLTEEEQKEQHVLRQAFLASFRANLQASLDKVVVQHPDGTKQPLAETRKKNEETN